VIAIGIVFHGRIVTPPFIRVRQAAIERRVAGGILRAIRRSLILAIPIAAIGHGKLAVGSDGGADPKPLAFRRFLEISDHVLGGIMIGVFVHK